MIGYPLVNIRVILGVEKGDRQSEQLHQEVRDDADAKPGAQFRLQQVLDIVGQRQTAEEHELEKKHLPDNAYILFLHALVRHILDRPGDKQREQARYDDQQQENSQGLTMRPQILVELREGTLAVLPRRRDGINSVCSGFDENGNPLFLTAKP